MSNKENLLWFFAGANYSSSFLKVLLALAGIAFLSMLLLFILVNLL